MTRSDIDLELFRQRLHDMRASLEEEMTRFDQETGNDEEGASYGATNHPADEATVLLDRNRNQAVGQQVQAEIERVDHALQRIDDGTYGICEVGGEMIPIERLEFRPVATLCIQHQREADQQDNV